MSQPVRLVVIYTLVKRHVFSPARRFQMVRMRVVMQENCTACDGEVLVHSNVSPGENVRPRGNDIEAQSVVLPAGLRLRAQDLGLAASVGLAELSVRRSPRVAILSSGDELVSPGESLGPGQIYNSNRFTLLGLLQGLGCRIQDLGLVPDNFDATVDASRKRLVRPIWSLAVVGSQSVTKTTSRAPLNGSAPWTCGGWPSNPVNRLPTPHRRCRFYRPARQSGIGPGDVLSICTPVYSAQTRCAGRVCQAGACTGRFQLVESCCSPGVCTGTIVIRRRRRKHCRAVPETGLGCSDIGDLGRWPGRNSGGDADRAG